MGLLSFLKTVRNSKEKSKILVLGLDCAGKTSILKALSSQKFEHLKPTEGFNIKVLEIGGVKINIWDLGGQKVLRQYWSNYFEKTNFIMYVVDSADEDWMEEAGKELKNLLEETELKDVPILVYANK